MSDMSLGQQLRSTSLKLGQQLTAKRNAQTAARQNLEAALIERQIKEAPATARELIAGLPAFLHATAEAGYDRAYVVHRGSCQPMEENFPGFVAEHPPGKNRDVHAMSEYAIRRYMKGVVQHVALWGHKQGLSVGLCNVTDRHAPETWLKQHNGVLPIYMPGMMGERFPIGINIWDELLYFAW